MEQTPDPLLPTPDPMRRLVYAERTCYLDWVRAMEAEPGNPFGIAVEGFGAATALACRAIPAQIWNRVFGLTEAEAALDPSILAFYRHHGADVLFDVPPTSVPPFWEGPNVLLTLARHGLHQGAFHQLLHALPRTDVPLPPAHVEVEEIGPERASDFVGLYEQVWGDGGAIRVLLGRPRFRSYLSPRSRANRRRSACCTSPTASAPWRTR